MSQVIHGLRLASTIACGIVLIAFVLWASDEGRATTQGQVAHVAADGDRGPAPVGPSADEKGHGGVRGAIETADRALLSPFDHVAQSNSPWIARGIPALLALLTYGLLARILLAYLPARA